MGAVAGTSSSGESRLGAYVALLRGINVGGKNKLPMAALVEICSEAGCRDARTYIQSGNVVFAANPKEAKRLGADISDRIADRFGLQVPVVLRSGEQMRRIAAANPFLPAGAGPETLHVAFLDSAPERRRIADLDPERSPGDAYEIRGAEIFLHLSTGAARTRLSNAYFDATLGTTSTMRNWRTVLKLVEMTSGEGRAPG